MAEENDAKALVEYKKNYTPKKEKKSLFSRIWGLIWLHGDDFEQRLQYISKAEASLLTRIKKRASRRRRMARDLIVFSVILEVAAIGYAIMTTRTVNLDWRVRSLRVLPMFLLPVLSRAFYSGLITVTGMCDRRDQKNLEKLRAERQEKIDELKERTNYYNTQQLIQKYDPDPAAKAAAASVLASKLGADSGLQVSVADEPQPSQHGAGKSSDVEFAQSTGLRRRNPPEARSPGVRAADHSDKESTSYAGSEVSEISLPSELVVEHHNPMAMSTHDGGWIARLAALLVGDDPSQSYALICGNCHSHNGLARKEEYPFITYYCPHCHSLNKPRKSDENPSGTSTPDTRSSTTHRHPPNKPKNSDENLSDTNNTPDTRSSMADANLRKQSSESTSENVSAASSIPEAIAAKES